MTVFDVVFSLIGITLALLSYSYFTVDSVFLLWILCHNVLLIMIKERGAAVLILFLFLIMQISLPQCNLPELLHSIVTLESLPFFFTCKNLFLYSFSLVYVSSFVLRLF